MYIVITIKIVINSTKSNQAFVISCRNEEQVEGVEPVAEQPPGEGDKPISLPSTSSAAANTSSSSINSNSGRHRVGLIRRDPLITRHFNQNLNETNIKLIEEIVPSMTHLDRVMNWMIAEEFSDPEDDLELDETKAISAIRSERVSFTINIQCSINIVFEML